MSGELIIERRVLSENDRLAQEIRSKLREKSVASLNLVSSPGSGKTSLLENTLKAIGNRLKMGIIAGDVQTENDALRLSRAGGDIVKSVVTGGACHLDARMVGKALGGIKLENIDILFIENVGNLVCPSGFDLGEDMKVALISVPEGDDKPMKYPAVFRRSAVLVINKIDLMGYSDFSIDRARMNALRVNPALEIFEVSCRTGQGLEKWYEWLIQFKKRSGEGGN
jgi:hydrogenase nickel incorporation protein HypB